MKEQEPTCKLKIVNNKVDNFSLAKIYRNWPGKWQHIAPINFLKKQHLFFYGSDTTTGFGELHEVNARGEIMLVRHYFSLPENLTQIIPLTVSNKQLLLFYAKSKFLWMYEINAYGELKLLTETNAANKEWLRIVPLKFLGEPWLFFYGKSLAKGFGELSKITLQGEIKLQKLYDSLSNNWEQLIPVNYAEKQLLFAYGKEAKRGVGEFLTLTPETYNLTTIKSYAHLDQDWTQVISTKTWPTSSLLFYNQPKQRAKIYEIMNYDLKLTLNEVEQWRDTLQWQKIAADNFPNSQVSQFFLYDGTEELQVYNHFPFSWPIRPIEVYASQRSIYPNEKLDFHVMSASSNFTLTIECLSCFDSQIGPITLVKNDHWQPFSEVECEAYKGCDWPIAVSWNVPDHQPSGLYLAKFTLNGYITHTQVPFIIKPTPGSTHAIAVSISQTTYAAYNWWGGKSLYGFGIKKGENNATQNWFFDMADRLTFDRPYLTPNDFPKEEFLHWELPFIKWLKKQKLQVDFYTNLDLHKDNQLLTNTNYKLLLSIGHDEYWSAEMFNNTLAFIETGNDVAFLSGNVCWWKIQLEPNNRTMVCDKLSEEAQRWQKLPPYRTLTGLQFNGTVIDKSVPRSSIPFKVHDFKHWIFNNTGLGVNTMFGTDNRPNTTSYDAPVKSIVGYEVDEIPGMTCMDGEAPLLPSEYRFSGAEFEILASANFKIEGSEKCLPLGFFRRHPDQKSQIFVVGTTDWTLGLEQEVVSNITKNLLTRYASQDISSESNSMLVISKVASVNADALLSATQEGVIHGCINGTTQVISNLLSSKLPQHMHQLLQLSVYYTSLSLWRYYHYSLIQKENSNEDDTCTAACQTIYDIGQLVATHMMVSASQRITHWLSEKVKKRGYQQASNCLQIVSNIIPNVKYGYLLAQRGLFSGVSIVTGFLTEKVIVKAADLVIGQTDQTTHAQTSLERSKGKSL